MNEGIIFFHTGDVHLDSPLKGIKANNRILAKKLADASYDTFKTLIKHAVQDKADFVLICGDLFDSEKKSIKTILFLKEQFDELLENDIKVIAIAGNHDPYFSWPEDLIRHKALYLFDPGKVSSLIVESRKGIKVNFTGYSYNSKALRESIHSQYEISKEADFNIALLHGSAGDIKNEHHRYAPFNISELKNSEFDYWALGHIHKPEILGERMAYCGIPQPRNFKELSGGNYLRVNLKSNIKPDLNFVNISKIEFRNLELNVSENESITSCLKTIKNVLRDADGEKFYVNRVNLTGESKLLYDFFKIDSNKEEFIDNLNEFLADQLVDNIYPRLDQYIEREIFFNSNPFFKELKRLLEEYPITKHIEEAYLKNKTLKKVTDQILDEEEIPMSKQDIERILIDLFKAEFDENN
ncbi:DNA repair exonuclease [Mangrovivirga sp. M17]|uniref:DNA repair exonuclease n=1 Tax=Mangrovivirga halotolerans TaxID=2993936 RepID=A0ABT3RRR9_9BACT|nr:DNA repair exonuclease [Mangrovivirga halotolerans]MCX2744267.1 DNA repair exonuclease [Mangrovivirga halotolerans]